jgi:2-haloacid dehalogenase
MQAYLELRCWPDVQDALLSLRKAGIIRNSQLEFCLTRVLSTNRVKADKPDLRAYQMASDAFGLKPEQILFAGSRIGRGAGAKSFGYSTFWANTRISLLRKSGASMGRARASNRLSDSTKSRLTVPPRWPALR